MACGYVAQINFSCDMHLQRITRLGEVTTFMIKKRAPDSVIYRRSMYVLRKQGPLSLGSFRSFCKLRVEGAFGPGLTEAKSGIDERWGLGMWLGGITPL